MKRAIAMAVAVAIGSGIGTAATPTSAQSTDYIGQAFAKTRSQQYDQAIALLQKGQKHYQQRGDQRRAYASKLLIAEIRQDIKHRRTLRTYKELPVNGTNHTKMGSCIGTNCNYGIGWFDPPGDRRYGGILVMHRQIGTYRDARQLQQPLWGWVDVKVLPKLQTNDWVASSQCTDRQKKLASDRIVALVSSPQNPTSSPFTNKVRQAWLVNTNTRRFENIPVGRVSCISEIP
jgi:hypothetical protein